MSKDFKIKYKRPIKLSDPHQDFSPGMLKGILAKDDADLKWYDFQNLLGPFLPAGTYDEVVYFLPLAFDYIKTNEEDALDLVTALFGFCSKNINKLNNDGLGEVTKEKILECLNYWSRDFRIIHFDKQGCKEKGWGLEHSDLIMNSEVICEGTTDLVRFEAFQDLAISFTQSLAYHGNNIIKASWFLEYSRSRFAVYTPPNIDEIANLLSDKNLLNSAYATIWPTAIDEKSSPTYWRDTFNQLGI